MGPTGPIGTTRLLLDVSITGDSGVPILFLPRSVLPLFSTIVILFYYYNYYCCGYKSGGVGLGVLLHELSCLSESLAFTVAISTPAPVDPTDEADPTEDTEVFKLLPLETCY